MTIELRELRWAIIASQHRSLSKAAAELNVRQSTLSRSLRNLEYKLGVSLFERTNGGTRPSMIGQEFLADASRIIDEIEGLSHKIREKASGDSGVLTIGVYTSLSAGNFRATLIEYNRRFPNVILHLIDGSNRSLISNTTKSSIDIAFVVGNNDKIDGKYLPVWSERIILAIPENHPLSKQEIIYWDDLKNETILVPQCGPGPEFLNILSCKIGGVRVCNLRYHHVSLDRLLTLVSTGTGILLILEGATGGNYPGVTFREMWDREGPTRFNFYALWREGNSNPSLLLFLNLLRERYPDLTAVISSGV